MSINWFSVTFILLVLLVLVVDNASANTSDDTDLSDNYCGGSGWTPYDDEKCYKLIKKWATRDEAKEMCAQEWLPQSDASTPQLVTIQSVQEQNYLTEFVFEISEVETNVWIGAKRLEANSNKFVWDDGSEVRDFTNWAEGNPTGENGKDCVEMKSKFTRKEHFSINTGKWRDMTCKQGNYVLCEKMQRWSLSKLQHSFLATRKKLAYTENQLSNTQNQLTNTQTELKNVMNQQSGDTIRLIEAESQIENLRKNPVPIGFIYVQLSNQPDPKALWSNVQWQDVTLQYAGLFFRAEGSGSAQFGTVQDENAPRVTQVKHKGKIPGSVGNGNWDIIDLNVGGWSSGIGVFSGSWDGNFGWVHHFYQSGGEVRPRNTAMRIWKRIN